MAAHLTDEQKERLHLEYALTGSYRAAARAVGVSPNTARNHIKPELEHPDAQLAQIRTQKRIDIAEKLGELQIVLIDALMRDDKINKASFQELANTLGIATEKRQLITGQATERHEHRDLDEPRQHLASRIDELAARRRAQGDSGRVAAVGS